MDSPASITEHQQKMPPSSAYAACLTPESKEKGDAGIYAALDAVQLSRALRGAAESRLDISAHHATVAAGGGVAGARVNGAGGSNSSVNKNGIGSSTSNGNSCSAVQLGMEPEVFRHGAGVAVQAIVSNAVVEALQAAPGDAHVSVTAMRAAVRRGMEGGISGTSSTAVGVPESVEALEQVLPLVQELKPREALNYDALQRLFTLLEKAAAATAEEVNDMDADGAGNMGGITTLLLSKGVVDPAKQPMPSTAAWEARYNELQVRYPLPITPLGKDDDFNDNDLDEDTDNNDGDEEGGLNSDRQHNAALQERCATLKIPYTTYKKALRDVALYEMRVFPLLCAFLSHNDTCRERGNTGVMAATTSDCNARDSAHTGIRHCACANVKVLNLAGNQLAAPAAPPGEDNSTLVRQLAPLRALAAMIDANESLRYLNLRDNALGPRGVGIVAKALTKNIALTGIDLSANLLNGAATGGVAEGGEVEEVEDPLYEEDPVFGETLEGLDALAEVLKKNKFLRVLRLGENGLHAGEDLAGLPPPEEEDENEPDEEEPGVDVGQSDEASSDETRNSNTRTRASSAAVRKGMSIAEAQERWQGVPLWNLLTPLHLYHRLRVLDLSKNFLGNTGAHMVAVALSHNHSIEVLDLTDNAIGYSGLNHLARYLFAGSIATTASSFDQKPQSCALHTLNLRQNPLSRLGGAADAANGVDTRRRRLTKRQQKRAEAAIENFAAGLRRHGHLRRLILANTYLGPAASAVVLRALADVPTLEELDFSFNNACGTHTALFDATALPHIAALLFPPSASAAAGVHIIPALQRLCLDGNNLTATGLAALLSAKPDSAVSPAIREVTLSRNSLGDALGPLAALLASGLTRLDLSYNDITTMAALSADLSSAAALEDINLSHNMLGVQEGLLRKLSAAEQEVEVSDFFHALVQTPNLSVVDLSYNDWRPAHIEQLNGILADVNVASNLRKLDVRHTPHVPAKPLMTLLQTVGSRPNMEVISASVIVERVEDEAAATTATGAETGMWTFEAVVAAIHSVVSASDSLVDVDCGLRLGDAADRGAEGSQMTETQVEQIRERLLFNALMAASSRVA